MPTVTTAAMALPGIALPQHLTGKTQTVQSFVWPGAVQPQKATLTVTTSAMALPGIPFPQHLSGKTNTVQSYLFPGAIQPNLPAPPAVFSLMPQILT